MTIRKKIILVGAVLVAATIAITFIALQRPLSDDEIKEKFACNRVTADARSTDVYCKDPGLYREHLKSGTVVQ